MKLHRRHQRSHRRLRQQCYQRVGHELLRRARRRARYIPPPASNTPNANSTGREAAGAGDGGAHSAPWRLQLPSSTSSSWQLWGSAAQRSGQSACVPPRAATLMHCGDPPAEQPVQTQQYGSNSASDSRGVMTRMARAARTKSSWRVAVIIPPSIGCRSPRDTPSHEPYATAEQQQARESETSVRESRSFQTARRVVEARGVVAVSEIVLIGVIVHTVTATPDLGRWAPRNTYVRAGRVEGVCRAVPYSTDGVALRRRKGIGEATCRGEVLAGTNAGVTHRCPCRTCQQNRGEHRTQHPADASHCHPGPSTSPAGKRQMDPACRPPRLAWIDPSLHLGAIWSASDRFSDAIRSTTLIPSPQQAKCRIVLMIRPGCISTVRTGRACMNGQGRLRRAR